MLCLSAEAEMQLISINVPRDNDLHLAELSTAALLCDGLNT